MGPFFTVGSEVFLVRIYTMAHFLFRWVHIHARVFFQDNVRGGGGVHLASVTHLTGISINAISEIVRGHKHMSRRGVQHIGRVVRRMKCEPGLVTHSLTIGGPYRLITLVPSFHPKSC